MNKDDKLICENYIDKRKLDSVQYLEDHLKSGLHEGDTVLVIRAAKSYENGWNLPWLVGMEELVGQVGIIYKDQSRNGFTVQFNIPGIYVGPVNLPYFSLKRIDNMFKDKGDIDIVGRLLNI